jgi:hypothetical protein
MNKQIEVPTGSLRFRSQLGIKAKRPNEKRPFIEQRVGDDFHRATGTWRKLERVINRDTDTYHEVIRDADGNEIRRCDEPLSAHRGRGSAKRAAQKSKK